MKQQGSHSIPQALDHSKSPRLLSLAGDVVKEVEALTSYVKAHSLEEPNFSYDSPELPESAEYLRIQARLSPLLEDLRRLVEGPRRTVRSMIGHSSDLTALQSPSISISFAWCPAKVALVPKL
jgi:hypothetical protein